MRKFLFGEQFSLFDQLALLTVAISFDRQEWSVWAALFAIFVISVISNIAKPKGGTND